MNIRSIKNLLIISIIIFNYSCVGGKYTYEFNTGKSLDFSSGKWILNNTQSNSTIDSNKMLYYNSYKVFHKILGDSLIDLTTLRNIALVGPEIKFKPTKSDLQDLYENSNCDFLINVKGEILSNDASSYSLNEPDSNYSTSNRSVVFIEIFDLKNGIIISSSKANAIDTQQNSKLDKEGSFDWTTDAEPMMIQAAERLINKYNEYRLDK